MASPLFMRIISGLSLVSCILAIAAYIFTYVNGPSYDMKLRVGQGLTPGSCTVNMQWFSGITLIVLAIVSIGYFIYEIFLLISPIHWGFTSTGLTRSIFYALSGLSVLGVSADLGIAAGVLTLISALLVALVWILSKIQIIVVEKPQQQPLNSKA